jgi:glycosyltransferase involved in cell wall biosynthesis
MNDAYEFSVIIPALNEAKRLPAALAPVLHRAGVETLVVDGGSQDGTATVAEQHGAKTLAGPSCRAIQMNIGAAAAKGRTLVFLHADTLLPHDWPVHV